MGAPNTSETLQPSSNTMYFKFSVLAMMSVTTLASYQNVTREPEPNGINCTWLDGFNTSHFRLRGIPAFPQDATGAFTATVATVKARIRNHPVFRDAIQNRGLDRQNA